MSIENMEMSSTRQYISMIDMDSKSPKRSSSPKRSQEFSKYQSRFKQQMVPSEPYLNTEKLEQLEDLYDISKSSDKTLLIVTRTSRLKLKKLWKEFPVFQPNSWGVLLFESVIAFLILVYFFTIPMYMAFGNIFFTEFISEWGLRSFIVVSFFLFLFDTLIEFNTAYYMHGNLVTKKSKIAKHYIQNNFVFDVIALIAFGLEMMQEVDKNRWIYLFFYFKTPSLIQINNFLEEAFLLLRKTRNLYAIFKIVMTLLFCFDVYGCFFFMIGKQQASEGYPSWITHQGNFGQILYLHPHKQFFFSFYFSVGTLSSTMGYGDIQPLNIPECAFCLVGIMFAVFIFAININYIFKTMEDYNQNENRILKNRIAITRFMKNKNVPAPLRERVRQYLNEHWYEEGSREVELEQLIINQLAPELKEELMYFSYGTFLQKLPMFSNNFSRAFLRELSKTVQEICYASGEIIFVDKSQEFLDDQSFYFINFGSILIKPNLDSTHPCQLNKLKNNEYFGEYTFFTGKQRLATATAYNYSSLYKITRKDFLATLKEFPEDFEQYCLIREKISLNEDFNIIGTSCWSCGSSNHYSSYCTLSHYQPQPANVVDLHHGTTKNQTRIRYQRSNRLPWNTLTEFQKNQKIKRKQSRMVRKKKYIIKFNQLLKRRQSRNFDEQEDEQKENDDYQKQRDDPKSGASSSDSEDQSDTEQKKQVVFASDLENLMNEPDIDQQEIEKILKQSKIHKGVINFDQPYSFRRYYPNYNFQLNPIYKDLLVSNFHHELK